MDISDPLLVDDDGAEIGDEAMKNKCSIRKIEYLLRTLSVI